ncbi:hypothetical protein ASF28_18635 [Methylobacterium sp. Leaf99]|uniref:hypothetical protein n=1 Tax=Methylobacterium sp. Leaf99 TaxID=1736251 RepID=UPI0006F7C95A|nr:hypothetical protein [Methylobacterium sp. Leaf99]KQP05906.1 hypothetical protein ASF28_18635 [Methylobacterium sp. Leaf99]
MTITPAQLDAAKTVNYDRGYREGFDAATAGHPYGSDSRVGVLGQDGNGTREPASFSGYEPAAFAPSTQPTAFSWAEITAIVNAQAGLSTPTREA